eukprot:gb/GECG01009989.1/.p1 GENE.gb/GECG01009989.1/~~gb/GECG01009989.1/.p1  ORF type:complete len:474 (+),score=49.64 gb/GECG01009989.1/:1-1422(+)
MASASTASDRSEEQQDRLIELRGKTNSPIVAIMGEGAVQTFVELSDAKADWTLTNVNKLLAEKLGKQGVEFEFFIGHRGKFVTDFIHEGTAASLLCWDRPVPARELQTTVRIRIGEQTVEDAVEPKTTTVKDLKKSIHETHGFNVNYFSSRYTWVAADSTETLYNLGMLGEEDLTAEIELIKINVKTLTGETYTPHVSKANTVLSLKNRLQELAGIPVGEQRIIFDEKQLQNHRLLEEYNVSKEDKPFHLVLEMRGGDETEDPHIDFSNTEVAYLDQHFVTATPGLNLEYACCNTECSQFNNPVLMTSDQLGIGRYGEFDLVGDSHTILCPQGNCKTSIIRPVFTDCRFMIKGRKFDEFCGFSTGMGNVPANQVATYNFGETEECGEVNEFTFFYQILVIVNPINPLGQGECRICFNDFEDRIITLPCKHQLCTGCKQAWFNSFEGKYGQCPFCRDKSKMEDGMMFRDTGSTV